jgi:hypothetical protein
MKEKQKAKFKMGDKVCVVGNCSQASKDHNGMVGLITKVGRDYYWKANQYQNECGNFTYEVDNHIVVWEKDLKHFKEKIVAGSSVVKTPKFKVGDKMITTKGVKGAFK